MKELIALTLIAASFTACKKTEDVQPTPTAQAQMTRSFTYPSSSVPNQDAAYTKADITLMGQVAAGALVLGFDAPANGDFIGFTVPTDSLTVGYVGTYQLIKSQPTPSGVVETRYSYVNKFPAGSLSTQLFSSSTNFMTGNLTISAYDSQRRLISGSFEMGMDGVPDPQNPTTVPVAARANVRVRGTFANVAVK